MAERWRYGIWERRECRTSNKIILTTRLNYAHGTNNNIWPARIPAINIVAGSEGEPPPCPLAAGFHPPFTEPSSSRSTSKAHLNYVEQNYGARLYRPRGGACEKRGEGLTPARGSQLPVEGVTETWESRWKRVVTGNRFRS